jgi:hypothetical protein
MRLKTVSLAVVVDLATDFATQLLRIRWQTPSRTGTAKWKSPIGSGEPGTPWDWQRLEQRFTKPLLYR